MTSTSRLPAIHYGMTEKITMARWRAPPERRRILGTPTLRRMRSSLSSLRKIRNVGAALDRLLSDDKRRGRARRGRASEL
jgi:hypothetical protein